ncbi:MAG TPA: enoyl-CoA hydratase-related protein [Gemmatimonadaceae bacterium]|nr:enoyl-CoA hydratase-related protein [Gemmatimonadaceae bacterium]
MEYDFVRYSVDQGVATIMLSRPDVLNSFNRRMAQEVQKALAAASADGSVRAVLLTGNGRGFCAGQDLAEATAGEPGSVDLGDIVAKSYAPMVVAIRELPKPVVCAVNGVAAGAGANLALTCDIVIASEDASFVQSFSKIGLVPDTGGTFFLPRIVGMARASALMFLAEKVSAQKAVEWGMIYQVVPAAVLQESALALARQLAAMPTRGLGLIKQALNRSATGGDYRGALATEEALQREAGRTEDYLEGVRAFLEKRKPVYTGR